MSRLYAVVFLLAAASFGAAWAQVTVSLDAPDSVALGGTPTVVVAVTSVVGLDTALINLTYDAQVLTYERVHLEGSFGAGGSLIADSGVPGELAVLFNMSGFEGASGEGVLASVEFTATAYGVSELALDDVMLGDIAPRAIPSSPGPPIQIAVGTDPELALRNSWVFDPSPDGNGDGVANPGERIQPRVRLKNEGDRDIENALVTLTIDDPDVTVVDGDVAHAAWPGGVARNNNGFVLDIDPDATSHDVSVIVDVTADNGGPWQFTIVFPVVGASSELALRNAWIFEPTASTRNGQADPGERVHPRVRLANEGPADAQNVNVALSIDDPEVTVVSGSVTHAAWPAGVVRNNEGLALDISPNATSHDVSVTVSVTADNGGPWQFTFTFPVVAPSMVFSLRNAWLFEPTAATRNGQANPGEQVHPRVRIKNDGPGDAQNVTVTLSIDDPDVTVVNGSVTHATWPAGVARNNEGLVVAIASDATPHDVPATVHVTADSGGRWLFSFTIPIVDQDAAFSLRNSWAFDPAPDGNGNGQADAGERVRPRIRIRNDGPGVGRNVRVTLTTDDPALTVVSGDIMYESWPVGAAHNNDAFAIDISPTAAPHEAALTVDVTADHGGPWHFLVPLAVLPAPVHLEYRNAWVFDPAPADGDGQANPGERVRPTIRLTHAGVEDAQNVHLALSVDNPDITVVNAEASHATWPAGEARNSAFTVDVAPGAASQIFDAAVHVTADNGGPWEFPLPLWIAGSAALTLSSSQARVGDTLTVSGLQLDPSTEYALLLDGAPLSSGVTSSAGRFSASFVAPPMAGGSHTLTALGSVVAFEVIPDVRIEEDTSSLFEQAYIVRASGLVPTVDMMLGFDERAYTHTTTAGPQGVIVGIEPRVDFLEAVQGGLVWSSAATSGRAIRPTAQGALVLRFRVPPKPPSPAGYALGVFTVAGTSNNSQDPRGDSLFSTFVPTDPQLFVTPAAGTAGAAGIRITGIGFAGPVALSLYPDGQPGSGVSLGTASINANSEIDPAVEVVVPAQATGGPSVIEATDTSGLTAYAPFLVWTGGVTLTPESATVGSQVTVEAAGFDPQTSLSILLDGTPVASATTDGIGTFAAVFTVPDVAGGAHIVSVAGVEVSLDVLHEFTVEEDTSTIFEQAYIVRGSGLLPTVDLILGLDERGYTHDTTAGPQGLIGAVEPRVDILDGVQGGLVWSSAATSGRAIRPTAQGTLVLRFRVPPKPPSPSGYALGTFTVATTHNNSQDPRGDSLFSTFVPTDPQVYVEPVAGTVGVADVRITGVGFEGPVTLSLYPHGQPGSGVSLGTASINANSEIEPAFEVVVPAGAVSGPSTIQATDTSGLTAYAAFLVWTGGVAVTPESATVGSQVALDATGFSPNTSFTILLDGEPVANASTNAGGDLQAAFAVPELAGGNHIVSVDGVETILEVVRDFTVEEDTSTIFEQAYLVRGSGLIPTVGLMVGFDGRAYTSDATAGPEGVVRGVDPRVDILEGSLGGLVWASAAPSGRTVRPTGLGTLAVRFRVPPKPLSPGGYALDLLTVASTTSNAQDPRGDSLFGTTVQTAPQVSVTPDAGTVGVDSVTVTGVGFSGEVALSLHPEANLSSGVLLGSASTNAQSAIDPAFEGVIPAQAIEGESVVQARDSAGRLAYAPLLVWRAGLTLGKTTAVVGESVPLTGFGFGTNTTLDVLFDGTVAGRVPVDGSGDMAGTFVVPPRSQGDYTVSVAGVRRTFAVLPHFVVTEEGADPFGNPTLMRISGSGIPGGDLLISLNGIAYTQDATVQAGAGLVDEDPRVTITDGVLGGLVFASTVTFGRTFRALADGSIALDFAPPMLPPPPPGPAGYELALVESAHAFFPGDDPRGAVVFSTAVLVAPSPVLAVRNQWVFDPGPDGNRDSEANSGERVQLRIRIKNESNVDAQNVRVTVTTDDPSIAVVNGEIEHATWPAGEARNSDGLVLDISPAATTHEAMLSVHITADNGGPWEFQVPIPIVRPAVVFSLRNSWVFDPTPTGDNDGEANRGERIRPRIRLRNDGDGEALNVRVTLLVDDPTVTAVNAEVAHATWPAGQARNNDGLVLQIAENAAPHDIPVVVRVVSDNGRTQEFPITISVIGPEIEFSLRNSWVFDPTPGGDKDGVADAGERVQPKVRLRNDGPLDGADVQVSLTTDDPDVTVVSGHVTHETWPAGVARNNDGLVLDISADATSHDALLTVTVASNTGGPWTFPLVMSIAAPAVQFSLRNSWVFEPTAATRNGKADAGERVQPRIRLRNDGPDEAQNVTVTLTTDDEDVRTVSSQVTHATWPGGGARNNEGFVFDIAEDATSHAAVFTVNVTADNGGPWQFQVTIPVAAPAVRFSQRKAWIFEPAAATRNGVADAGERVLPRVRLGHDGAEDAQNVVVTLTTEDPDITIVTGQVTHETWPAGAARNNEGMAVDIVDGATSHGALLTLTITADNGGPWVFAFAIPIAGTFSVRNAWVFDPAPGGDKNGVADAGERVLPRVRLRTDASADAQNVTVTLTTDDEDVTVVTGRVTHDTWPAGVARNNEGLVLDIAENATTHDASLTVTVTADGGGPWQFQISIPVAGGPTVSFVQRSSWIQDKVTGDGDGVAAPGEQVEVRARLLHDGVTDAANVVVTLSTVDEDVTVSSATVTHATWTAGHARNNVGLIVDLGEGVGPSVDFVLDVTADNGGPWTFSFTIDVALPAAPAALAMPEDIDLDGVVGIRDILAVATVYGRRASALPPADLNGDRLLDMADMMLIEAARVDVGVGAPSGHVSPAGLVERWLREARRADDGTTPFRRGIAALQGVLASLRPAVTAIYANYPNPFNPETWIPFDLSKAAEATVTIYDVMGSPVRRIELGSLDAGAYRARRSAAYWDGRNDHGEPVTSGVYVYELRAGTHRGMRRMVVRK